MKPIYLATEDTLSEAVADRLIDEGNYGVCVAVRMGKKGNGYLKKNIPSFIKISRSIPFFLLTDLDQIECSPTLIKHWMGKALSPDKFLFRVVVREIEAWLMADRNGFSKFSGIPIERLPQNPEAIENPKETLLTLVRRYGYRSIKAGILPDRSSTSKVGIAYNQTLCKFVRDVWSVEKAANVSDSLARTRYRLQELCENLDRV